MLARWVRAAHTVRRSFSAEAWGESRPRPASSSTSGRDTLGRRLLKLIFPKRSAVITLRKWAEEGKPLRKYELNSVVRELRNYRRYKHALEVSSLLFLIYALLILLDFDFGDYPVGNGSWVLMGISRNSSFSTAKLLSTKILGCL